RGIGILVQYFIALFIVVFLLVSLIPIVASQLQQIAILLNDHVNNFIANPRISLPLLTDDVNLRLTDLVHATLQSLSIQQFGDALRQLGESMSSIAQGSLIFATQLAGSVLSFLVELMIVLVFAFFIQIEREHLRSWVSGFFPARYRNYMDNKADAMHHKLARWARGQIVLGLAIGTLVYIALLILGMPYALTLAVLAAFTEFIPYMGPAIGAVPAILIAATQGGFLWALIVAGVYYIIQWCENNLLVPLIMKRAVGLSPIAILFAMLVAVSFPQFIHPVLGILLAVPGTTILALFIEDWRMMRQARR
ncbi:AI-2E family transporter, partial [Candidatus Peregrinibacteria bacterium]|nr:AI-2E family transporter [Candidatus Peregrinibacteria bacterium]